MEAILIAVFFFIVVLTVIMTKRFNDRKETVREYKSIDFDDEVRDALRVITGFETLNYAGGSVVKYFMARHLDGRSVWNGRILDCNHAILKFFYKDYGNGEKTIRIHSEIHYGECSWDGKEMHYNYPIHSKDFEYTLEDLKLKWNDIMMDIYCLDIDSPQVPEKVKKGNCSYWVAQ